MTLTATYSTNMDTEMMLASLAKKHGSKISPIIRRAIKELYEKEFAAQIDKNGAKSIKAEK